MYDISEQYAAWCCVKNAKEEGTLIKPKTCEGCEEKPPVDFHHDGDYQDKLQGKWLCRSCHRKEHEKIKRRELFAKAKNYCYALWTL